MKLSFSSEKAREVSARIQETVYYQAVQTSMRLAKELGSFGEFENSRYAKGELQVQLAEKHQALMPDLHFDWDALAKEVQKNGLRNSLLIAIAPTATIASIVGSYESIEPQVSNFFKRETLSGEFLQVNRYLINDLKARGLWNQAMQAKIISADGSIQNIDSIPQDLKDLYRTVWETPMKDLIDMAVERSAFICQSQSLNLFSENPSIGKLSSMYMYAWKQGVKTTYYLRSRAKTAIQKTTVSDTEEKKTYTAEEAVVCSLENPEACEACQ
jgi:ribonucleoside-diphosphate reductase alpha chain